MTTPLISRLSRPGAALVAALALVALMPGAALSDAPAGRYTVTTTTVLDTKTGLTWQRVSPGSTYNWADAKTYCATITGLPGTGWRLPTVKELATLLDFSRPTGYFIDLTVFNVPTNPVNMSGVFWTSTPVVGKPTSSWDTGAWNVYFKEGATYYNNVTVGAWVRCVR